MGEMMRLDLMKVSPWNCHLRWLNDATLFNRLVLGVILSLQLLNRVHHVLKPFFLLGHWHALTSDRRTPLRSRNHLKSLGARHCRTPSEIAQYWRQSRASQTSSGCSTPAIYDDNSDKTWLVLAAVLLHIKGQLSNQRAWVDGSNFGLAWSCLI